MKLEATTERTTDEYAATVSDAVWIATALLQQEYGEQARFSTEKILERVRNEHLTDKPDGTVLQHIRQHCVANRPPQPNTARMLWAWDKGERSLYRGQKPNKGREEGRTAPAPASIPSRYHNLHLLDWYQNEWLKHDDTDPLLALIGTWKYGDANDYVNELREGWQ